MPGLKLSNDYQRAFGKLYAKTPKSVFAAVAFSYAGWASGEEARDTEEQIRRFVAEWNLLHENGIVQQAAPRSIVRTIRRAQ